jgi:hypothetical protein
VYTPSTNPSGVRQGRDLADWPVAGLRAVVLVRCASAAVASANMASTMVTRTAI